MPDPRDLALDLYDAVLQGAPLERSLGAIAQAVGAQTGFISRLPLRNGVPVAAVDSTTFQLQASSLEKYNDWIEMDPRVQAKGWSHNGVYNFQHICPPDVFGRSAFWNDFARNLEPCFHTLMASFSETEDLTGVLIVHRPPGEDPFSAAEEGFMAALYPHLRQALLAGSRLQRAEQMAGWSGAGLDTVPQGVAVLNADGRVLHANAALEAMAAQQDGLALGPAGLSLAGSTAMANYRYAVRLAVAVAGGRIRLLPEGMNFGVPRPSGKSPWLMQLLPLRRTESGLLEGFEGAVAVVTDAAARRAPSAMLLQRVLDLTQAEADLAASLAAGQDIATQARKRGVSRETLRTQLAAIRRKTGCRRQAEVVALVLRLGG